MTPERMEVPIEIAAIQMILHAFLSSAAQAAPQVLEPLNEMLDRYAKDSGVIFTADDGRVFTVSQAARRAIRLVEQAGGRARNGAIQ